MPPIITLLTDLGLQDAYVGVMHGVILGIAPGARIVDLCHSIPPQNVRAGAFVLMTSYRYFPRGTIHVAVVDPGVGTIRRVVAVAAGGHVFVGPDNGLLSWAVDHAGGSDLIVSVEAAGYRLPQTSSTFHGRDIMAPTAAHIARGVPLNALGPTITQLQGAPFPQPQRHNRALAGEVIYVDRFGNCITNVPASALSSVGTNIVEVAGYRLPVCRTYADAAPGEPLALAGSAGYVEVAVNGGSAADALRLSVGIPLELHRG
ncbi:MAG: SAM-dependent chlorinase/fluorinase [Chloroflexi bacterium]|nr:SAM-dependent chlorinase/fluorinase [Chloroflexota bacterium]